MRLYTRYSSVLRGGLPFLVLLAPLWAQESTAWRDPSPHTVQFVTVDENVKLEVLDWGGIGRPVVLLSGLGNTAHVFDDFAPKMATNYHVYGITRRGFGVSSIPTSGYTANRLGDDVLAVLDSLKLSKPVLAGHSIAGEELSSVGSRRPDRVAGLIYLDAASPFAFDNGKGVSMDELLADQGPPQPAPTPNDVASFANLKAWYARTSGIAFPEAEYRQAEPTPDGRPGRPRTPPSVPQAIQEGGQKYSNLPVPILAISAMPQDFGPLLEQSPDPEVKKYLAKSNALKKKHVEAFEAGVPSARVVWVPGAHHYIFISHESEVLREMRTFLGALK
jgi:non-heme chloroperoxidase